MLFGAAFQNELRPVCCRENHPDQAIADCVEVEALAVLVEEVEVRAAVVINEESIPVHLWRIAALYNVVRLTRNDDFGHAGHADNQPLADRKVDN